MEKDLKDLLIDELQDLLSAEEQIVDALPKMATAAFSPDLKKAFETHLKETQNQITRIEQIFEILKTKKLEKVCKGMKGLIQEAKEVLKEFKFKSPIRDVALISKAQRIKHYEISAYGTVRALANEIELEDVADLLQESLDEEVNADKKLTTIGEGGMLISGVNRQAHLANAEKNKPKKQTSSPTKKAL